LRCVIAVTDVHRRLVINRYAAGITSIGSSGAVIMPPIIMAQRPEQPDAVDQRERPAHGHAEAVQAEAAGGERGDGRCADQGRALDGEFSVPCAAGIR
jgi:hypothetical protein